MSNRESEARLSAEVGYTRLFALALGLLLLAHWLYAATGAPAGAMFAGATYNLDDHMVYAAWMRQAMDGQFLFDNRFAVDAQPGLTIHLYFWLVGQFARFLGIPIAVNLFRIGLSVALVFLLGRLVRRISPSAYATKLALTLTILGGGFGFLVWHNFGQVIVRPAAQPFAPLLGPLLPIDVWQPEGFVFASMLTNSLFVVSLCLIVGVFLCVLDARESWKPVLPGALMLALLMNIHSYDVLLIALVLVGLLAMSLARKAADPKWVVRAVVIGLGAIPPALWFVYVLRNDPVFQARAATETFSPGFRPLVMGYLPMILLAFGGLALHLKTAKQRAGIALAGLVVVGLLAASWNRTEAGYLLSPALWGIVFAAVLVSLVLMSTDEPPLNLLIAWALVGLVAPYFPALFQRKLTMALAVPWAALAGIGLTLMVAKMDRSARNLVTVLTLIVLSASSLYWLLMRERVMLATNVSNTTVHTPYLGPDVRRILDYLNAQPRQRTILLAKPGLPSALLVEGSDGQPTPVPDEFRTPYIPDLNPIMAGLAGVYAYAGHWSETPDYSAGENRRMLADRIFSPRMPDVDRRQFLSDIKANFVVAPIPEAFPQVPLADLRPLGDVVVEGRQFRLIKLAL